MKTKPEFFVSVGPIKRGEGWRVCLAGSCCETVKVGLFENQAVAQEMAENLEKYLARLVQAVTAK